MLFNSLDFGIFLPIVFVAYWVVHKNISVQNTVVVLASYIFYGWWDWRFLSLIVISTLLDFFLGLAIDGETRVKRRKLYLAISIVINIGILGFFKYFNFFAESFVDAFQFFGNSISSSSLDIILPVGISFYTFQTLSYSIDIHRQKLEPTKDFLDFSAFVCFFPQLVAGPIERAQNLLPQLIKKRFFNRSQAINGLKLMLWGLFKKVVVADSLAPMVDDIFVNYQTYPASTLAFGAILFAFQIYGDFSGYSDIAIGAAKLFGIELMSNFKFPYFSKNIGEFWRKWHISLSTWFKDYIYIPLGGSRGSSLLSLRNILIIFIISGFWHGANWTFIFWGFFHALLFLPFYFIGRNKNDKARSEVKKVKFNLFIDFLGILFTFLLVCVGWVFFRSETLADAFAFLHRVFTDFSYDVYHHPRGYRLIDYVVLLVFFLVFEYIIRKDERKPFNFKNKYVRFVCYLAVIFSLMLFYDDGVDRSFIYFQF